VVRLAGGTVLRHGTVLLATPESQMILLPLYGTVHHNGKSY